MEQDQGLELLKDPVALELLASSVPARLAYCWTDGTPRVVPIAFHWNGEAFVMGTPPTAPKVGALAANGNVALTIDDDTFPYKVLLVRGVVELEHCDGLTPEYELAVHRCMGQEVGAAWVEQPGDSDGEDHDDPDQRPHPRLRQPVPERDLGLSRPYRAPTARSTRGDVVGPTPKCCTLRRRILDGSRPRAGDLSTPVDEQRPPPGSAYRPRHAPSDDGGASRPAPRPARGGGGLSRGRHRRGPVRSPRAAPRPGGRPVRHPCPRQHPWARGPGRRRVPRDGAVRPSVPHPHRPRPARLPGGPPCRGRRRRPGRRPPARRAPGVLRVGRSTEADLVVDDPDFSRVHAELTVGPRCDVARPRLHQRPASTAPGSRSPACSSTPRA